jgi:hypothetical protein
MSQPAGEIALLMLVDVGQGREARRVLVVFGSLAADRVADHVAQRLGAGLIGAPLAQLFERREQLVVMLIVIRRMAPAPFLTAY